MSHHFTSKGVRNLLRNFDHTFDFFARLVLNNNFVSMLSRNLRKFNLNTRDLNVEYVRRIVWRSMRKLDVRKQRNDFVPGRWRNLTKSVHLQHFVRISTYGFDRNVGRWAEKARKHRLRFRPFPARNAPTLITRPNFVQNFTALLIRKGPRSWS